MSGDLPPDLIRWVREGEAAGLRLLVVPVTRGYRRVGIRRVPASREEERASVAEHAAAKPLALRPEALAPSIDDAEAVERLGLPTGETAVFLLDPAGRIAARLAAKLPDLAPLDAAVQRASAR